MVFKILLKNPIFVFVMAMSALTSCHSGANKMPSYPTNDTLDITYLDTFLIGKQVFPRVEDTSQLKELISEEIFSCFKSANYCYVFYNRKRKIDYLYSSYWDHLVPLYLNHNNSEFVKIVYSDGPFLTGFYNSKDSIILYTSDLRTGDLKNIKELRVRYLSTSDTLLKFNRLSLVGMSLEQLILQLRLPIETNLFKGEEKFKIVLLEATSLIANTWYNRLYPECCLDYSVAVVLSFVDNKIVQVQYLDFENIEAAFKQKELVTKDIHYN